MGVPFQEYGLGMEKAVAALKVTYNSFQKTLAQWFSGLAALPTGRQALLSDLDCRDTAVK
jgi:hypothetical protein